MATIKAIAHQLTMTEQERSILKLAIQGVVKAEHWTLPGETYMWGNPSKAAMLLKLYSFMDFESVEITRYQAELLVECMEQLKKCTANKKEDRSTWNGNDLLSVLKKAAK